MSRLQEVEQLIEQNTELINSYTKRTATLINSIRELEKEREKIMKRKKQKEIVYCKDCVMLNRFDCPFCTIEKQTLQFAEISPDFFCAKGRLKD